jgi:hypothetical protein
MMQTPISAPDRMKISILVNISDLPVPRTFPQMTLAHSVKFLRSRDGDQRFQFFYRSCDHQRRAVLSDKFRDLARIFRNKKTACPISVHEGAPGQELISTWRGSAHSSERRLQLNNCQSASPGEARRLATAGDKPPTLKTPMDRYCEEPTLAEILADPGTLALMAADGIWPRVLAATLSMILERSRRVSLAPSAKKPSR